MTGRKIVLGGLGAVILAALAVGYQLVEARSRAVLRARHPIPASAVRAASAPQDIAAGRHLAVVIGCTFCHGEGLSGPGPGPANSLRSPNLTLVAGHRSDGDLDRAIRRALNADGTSELAMPSYAYVQLADPEVAELIGYLRSLPPRGAVVAPRPPGFVTRLAIALGRFQTQTDRLAAARPPLEAGAQFEPGRHLAAVACGQCHGADLGGGPGLPGPDLTVRTYYSRAQFHELMKTGQMPQNVHSELMQEVARASFHRFTDAEVDAIYDYLQARDARLAAARQAQR
ncbi:MAG TPA: c-type cytochrome [Phenylobacterium sp.]|jgi:mono/diheme cytochrome c family protein|nr:c-type cytochrome [Phenylobacterium sp.]